MEQDGWQIEYTRYAEQNGYWLPERLKLHGQDLDVTLVIRTGSRASSAADMSVRLSLPAPAKLNLFLHILGRRDDGYHELQTLFQFLDHGDELHFEARQDGQVRLHTEIAGVPHDSNLIVRARAAEASGSLQGVDIWLDKRLPMGAASAAAAPTPPRRSWP